GGVSALGVLITDTGSEDMENFVFSDVYGGPVKIGFGGGVIAGSGSGVRDNGVYAGFLGSVTIAGSGLFHHTTTRAGNPILEIDGNTLIGGALTVTMNGPGATIDINDVSGLGLVEVKGPFTATMLGSSPTILVGDDEGNGASPVKFDSSVVVIGSFGGGGIF